MPEHLIIVGGGPFGIEMAQAHRRLGAQVTVLEARKALAGYDVEMSRRLLDLLRQEGVEIREGVSITQVQPAEGGFRAELSGPKGLESIEGSCLLLAAGRQPNVSNLNLSAAGIRFDKSGICVDAGLRTSNKKVFAIGDVAGGPAFTHVAEYHAGIVLRRMLFLKGELLLLAQFRQFGILDMVHLTTSSIIIKAGKNAELAVGALTLQRLRFFHSLIHHRKQLRPLNVQRIKGAAFNETLYHLFICFPQINPFAEVNQRGKGP